MPRKRSTKKESRRRSFKRMRSNSFVNARVRNFKELGKEVKFYDETNTNGFAAFSTSGTILSNSLNNIPNGIDLSQRIGRKITVVGLGLTYTMEMPVTAVAADTVDNLRIIVYLDKQANGAAAGPADILQGPVTIGSYRNLTNVNRFRVLSDEIFHLQCKAGAAAAPTVFGVEGIVRKVWMDLNVPIQFSGLIGSEADIRSNNLGILVVSSNFQATMQCNSRLRFTDM